MTYNELKHEFRLTNSGDGFGNCMAWLFAIADVIEGRVGCPASWEFRQSPLGPDTDAYEYQTAIECGTNTLLRFGEVLRRYRNKLAVAGLDY